MGPDKTTLDQLKIDRSTPPTPHRSPWPIVIILLLLLGGSFALWKFKGSKLPMVKTMVAQESSSGGKQTLLNGSGYVTARREATVSSKVTGKVIEVLIEEGMRVEAGQILARIDSSNVEASLQLSKAQVASVRSGLNETQVRVEEAERELRRMQQLAIEKIATAANLDKAESDVKSLLARLEKQKADVTVSEREVDLWQQQLDDTVVRAPFAGVITAKNAQPGEMISPMSAGGFTRTGICTIVDMNSLEIEVDVNESYINRVLPGQAVEATLDSYPTWKIPTKVIAIIPTANRQNATVKVRVGFEKIDPRILPQMGVKVAFQGMDQEQQSNRSISIPQSALHSENGRDIVWVLKDSKVERRAVTIGSKRGSDVTISAGLNAGEKIISESSDKLEDGMRVQEAKP